MPSARYGGKNLIVFMENLDEDCFVEEVEPIEFSWSGIERVELDRGRPS